MEKRHKRRRYWALFTILLAGVFATSHAEAAAIRYIVTDLGTLGGSLSGSQGSNAINSAGLFTGWAQPLIVPQNATYHAFRGQLVGDDVSLEDLAAGTDLGGLSDTPSEGYGINNKNQVVGAFDIGPGDQRAFRTGPNGVITSASILGFGLASDIDDNGVTVGAIGTSSKDIHAFRTTPNGPADDASHMDKQLGGPSSASAINASGEVVGYATFATGHHAFRTQPGQNITAAADLGSLAGGISNAYNINDLGQVVGDSTSDSTLSHYHAFRTTPGGSINALTDLGTLSSATESHAYAINNLGQTVGVSGDHAFFVDTTGPMLDLNSLIDPRSGWVLRLASGINDAGQIVGTGQFNTTIDAFLLTPVPVPEPCAVALSVMAGALMMRRGRRR